MVLEPPRRRTSTIVQWIHNQRRVRIVAVFGERDMPQSTGCDRRRVLGAALAALGVPELVMNGSGSGRSGSGTRAATSSGRARTSDSLGTLKQIAAGVLNVGYADAGPAGGRPVILLHGWPYDIHSFVDVVPLLASAGYRLIVPYLRGYGTTSFLSSETFRMASRRPSPSTSSR
jgi:hypothetical protein